MKKSLVVLLCTVLAVASCGCTKNDAGSTLDSIKESVSEKVGEIEEATSNKDYYLYDSKNIVYTVDGNGNMISKVDLIDMDEAFKAKGIDYMDAGYVEGVADGKLIVKVFNYEDENTDSDLYLYDGNTKEITHFYTVASGWSIDGVSSVNGKIYVDLRRYDPYDYEQHVFAKAEGQSEYKEEKSELKDMLASAKGMYIQKASPDMSMQEAYDEYGFIIAAEKVSENEEDYSTTWDYYKITKDGKEKISTLQNMDGYFEGYGKNWVAYHSSDDETHLVSSISLDDGTKNDISKDGKDLCIIQFSKDTLYYYEQIEKEYGIYECDVYAYDCAKNSSKLLYKTSTVPGLNGTRPGIDGFKVINGTIYVQQLFDDSLNFAYYDEASGVLKDTSLVSGEISAFKYGTINYTSYKVSCSNCGTDVERTYMESFVLDSKYSDHANEINKLLEKEDKDNSTTDEHTDECEYHKEDPSMYCEDYNSNISDVAIINDRFLTVNESSYWYGGGAHGMPGQEQRIFDLTTGEELGLKDFYSGTEADFKALVASKVKEDYESQPAENYKYFAEDAASAYDEAYESTTLSAEFYEDHATYSFPPYMLGSYASGFITVDIPYTELIGTDKLTRKAE